MTNYKQGVLSVRFSLVCATLVAGPLSIFFLAAPSAAQQPGGPVGPGPVRAPAPAIPAAAPAPVAASGCNVVVMDIAYIFKFHQRFKSKMEEIKQGIEQFDAYIKAEQGKFNTDREKLVQFNQGSPEFRAKEEALAKTKTELEVKMQQMRREFLEKEARVYYDTYGEIEATVKDFAYKQGIQLVLRFNRDEMKPDDRNSVLAGVNKAVIFQNGRDITDLILQKLNPPTTGGAPTGPSAIPQGTQTARPPASAPIIPQPQRPAPGIQR
jgi:Skp family chaperone for outer membrane proteins